MQQVAMSPLFAFAFLGLLSCSVLAQPNRFYYLFNDENTAARLSPYYRAYESSIVIPSSDASQRAAETDKRAPMKKNYDRNCFFSPVQCMLSYNNKNPHDAYYGRK